MRDIKHPSTCTLHGISKCIKTKDAMSKRILKSRLGFTMVEVITVIAIIFIMFAFGFVSILNIQRNMQQTELDGTAKELFIAAQNHLSTAHMKGFFNRSGVTKGESDSSTSAYYYVVGPDGEDDEGHKEPSTNRSILERKSTDYTNSALYQMLPYGSIDESVRVDGTYVIKYNPDTATVLGVFFARSSSSLLFAANTENFSFTNGDYQKLFGEPGLEGKDKGAARQNYNSSSGETVMIGWYGGEDLTDSKGILTPPILEVQNDERLTAIVENKTDDSVRSTTKQTLKLIIEGETSGALDSITLVKDGETYIDTSRQYVTSKPGSNVYYIDLDDITKPGGHFANKFANKDFIPGENLLFKAVSYSTAEKTNVAESGIVVRNSLFASLVAKRDAAGKVQTETVGGRVVTVYEKVKIANIRHLENLSSAVSGFNPLSTDNHGWNGNGPKIAVQTSDLSWTAFQEAIANRELRRASNTVGLGTQQSRSEDGANVKAVLLNDDGSDTTFNHGSFIPVTPATGFNLTYEGKSSELGDPHRILNVNVNTSSGNAALFGVTENLKVSDLVLVNSKIVTASGGNAAALLGAGNGTTSITNVLAYNEKGAEIPVTSLAANNATNDSDAVYGRESNEAKLVITGPDSVGGLVGSMEKGEIKQSVAALYVASTDGAAGGLVGSISDTAIIEQSYAGGHTADGVFLSDTNSDGDYKSGRMNVIANSSAGGLVGSVNNAVSLSIRQCYSSASVYSLTAAGGLVGTMNAGGISNSYTAGLVAMPVNVEKEHRGYFVGNGSAGINMSDNKYFEVINDPDDMNSIGLASGEATAGDADITAYNAIAPYEANAIPYDEWLNTHYLGKYSLLTIKELVGAPGASSLPAHLGLHYGDWPKLETFVVNTPTQS